MSRVTWFATVKKGVQEKYTVVLYDDAVQDFTGTGSNPHSSNTYTYPYRELKYNGEILYAAIDDGTIDDGTSTILPSYLEYKDADGTICTFLRVSPADPDPPDPDPEDPE